MHIHILGICGTFMGSLAQLAVEAGHRVTGADANVYPPMSTQLEASGIELIEGFDPSQLDLKPDIVVVGNVISRGNPVMEAILNRGVPYTSGPQWLADNILQNRWVLAVAGTHGKTTTTAMLAWILEYAGMSPGFLIGGVPANFSASARLGNSDFFVIEADEYDTAFFDKRSKFVHYHARTLLMNNLEFDHADIFPDLAAIQKQFHHLVRTVPENGLIVRPKTKALDEVLAQGCWTSQQFIGVDAGWQSESLESDDSAFTVTFDGEKQSEVHWSLCGQHNVANALGAIACARHVGVSPKLACEALSEFKSVKRRMELIGEIGNVRVYDDFAHHPTAIETTLAGLRHRVGGETIVAIIEPRSNTMKQGVHRTALANCVEAADHVFWFEDERLDWSLEEALGVGGGVSNHSRVFRTCDAIIEAVVKVVSENAAHVVIMSNGGFQGIHSKLVAELENSHT